LAPAAGDLVAADRAGAVLLLLRDQEPFGTSMQIVGAVLRGRIGALDALRRGGAACCWRSATPRTRST
jgi:hypothetical protein